MSEVQNEEKKVDSKLSRGGYVRFLYLFLEFSSYISLTFVFLKNLAPLPPGRNPVSAPGTDVR